MRRIGVGGFATVWLYRDEELASDVAVKALADNWAQRLDVRERFLEEARILRRADSDHVVRVYDLGETDNTPWFVMTYADQGTVADLVADQRPIAPDLTLDLVEQAGHGLTVLHQQGVIHRDIKPQNLLLKSREDGSTRLMVADLGVAKAMIHASGLTQVVGTPAYMAPEQAGGLGVDLRADVHALAAVTYHLLTGRLVREGGIGDLMAGRRPHAPSALVDVPPAVDDVLLRALHPRPERRWATVADYTTALRGALKDSPGRSALRGTVNSDDHDPPTRIDRDRISLGVSEEVTQQTDPETSRAVRRAATSAAGQAPPASADRPRHRAAVLFVVCLLVLAVVFTTAYLATRQLR